MKKLLILSLSIQSFFLSFNSLAHHPNGIQGESSQYILDNTKTNNSTRVSSSETDEEVSIYPNPASEHIYIAFEEGYTPNKLSIRLYDLLGKEIYFATINALEDNKVKLSIPDQQNKILILHLRYNFKTVKRKVILSN